MFKLVRLVASYEVNVNEISLILYCAFSFKLQAFSFFEQIFKAIKRAFAFEH